MEKPRRPIPKSDRLYSNEAEIQKYCKVKTYPGANIGSDHNPVVKKLNVKLKKLQKKNSKIKLDVNS